jgi:hypothetical protein
MEGTAWDARQAPSARVATWTAQQHGLILAAAWVGGSLHGCPWRSLGDHRGAQGGVRALSMGLMAVDLSMTSGSVGSRRGPVAALSAGRVRCNWSKPCWRVGRPCRCIVPQASAVPRDPAAAPAAPTMLRAGPLQDRPLSRADARRRLECWRDRPCGAHSASADLISNKAPQI